VGEVPQLLLGEAVTIQEFYQIPEGPLPSIVRLPGVSRLTLCDLFRELGFSTGAEIGLWEGWFAAHLCMANPSLHLYGVDCWADYAVSCGHPAPAAFTQAERRAMNRLRRFPQITLLRTFSSEAAREIPDRSLDFVFIDGGHTYDEVTRDLEEWSPKVRSGGLISGHDYRAFEAWENEFPIGVVEAVDAYVSLHQIPTLYVLGPTPREKCPSYFWVNP